MSLLMMERVRSVVIVFLPCRVCGSESSVVADVGRDGDEEAPAAGEAHFDLRLYPAGGRLAAEGHLHRAASRDELAAVAEGW